MKKTILVVVLSLLGGFLLIQFVPYRVSNPPVRSEPKWDSPRTRQLAVAACFDCHSNETVWPWYSYVAPVSWLVYNDTMEGRGRLNFSEWNTGFQRGAGEIVSKIQEGEMPPAIYLPMHPSAQLTATEKQQLIDGLTNTLK